MQRRKNSAIIHGLREPSVDNIESAKKEDGELISELLHELNCDDVSVKTSLVLADVRKAAQMLNPNPSS